MPKEIAGGSWKSYIKGIVLEKALHINPGRGEIKRLFEDASAKFGIAFNTAKAYYYKELRPELEEAELSKEKTIHLESKEEYQEPKLPSVGEVVPVTVVDIAHYGVFVDYKGFKGFIHISEVKHGYTKVEHLPELFEVGTSVKARVKKIERDKIHFITKGLSLVPVDKELTNKNDPVTEDSNGTKYCLKDDYNDIISYLNGYVGALSPDAKGKLKELIKEYGIFSFSMKMIETTKDFKADLGSILISGIEDKLINEGKSWEIEYHLTSHAIAQGESRASKNEEELLKYIRESEVYVDLPKYRYLKYNDLYFFPCSKESSGLYNVLTVLLWEDVKDQVEFILYKYSQEDSSQ